jgi:hypothetical protein
MPIRTAHDATKITTATAIAATSKGRSWPLHPIGVNTGAGAYSSAMISFTSAPQASHLNTYFITFDSLSYVPTPEWKPE